METLDEFFSKNCDPPLLSMDDYKPVSSSKIENCQSLVNYSDSDWDMSIFRWVQIREKNVKKIFEKNVSNKMLWSSNCLKKLSS